DRRVVVKRAEGLYLCHERGLRLLHAARAAPLRPSKDGRVRARPGYTPSQAQPLARPSKVFRNAALDSLKQRGVAQPGSAPALGAGGPRFKSGRPDYNKASVTVEWARTDARGHQGGAHGRH